MRKVNLSMKELEKYEIIKRLVENGVSVSGKKAAAVKLNCTIRNIDRLINKYKANGKYAFSHKNKGRSPFIKYDEETKRKIINMYIKDYPDANIKHFTQIVYEDLNIKISDETIRLWFIEEKIISPKTHKITKKRIKKVIKEELKVTKTKKEANKLKEKLIEVDINNIHPRRPRCKYIGEMIQMDASEYEWINNQVWHLHLAIDDASGKVVGAYFDYEETLYGYYQVFKQILINYGVPVMFYTDKRTVFEYKRKNRLGIKKRQSLKTAYKNTLAFIVG